MYQYNSIMSAVNAFIDEVNESDSEAKLEKPHTIKKAYEILAEYYGKDSASELLEAYNLGRPHDVADATKLLLDVMKNGGKENKDIDSSFFYYVTDGERIKMNHQSDHGWNSVQCPEDLILVPMVCEAGRSTPIWVILTDKEGITIDIWYGDRIEYPNAWPGEIIINETKYYYFFGYNYSPTPTDVIKSNLYPCYITGRISDTDLPYVIKYAYLVWKNGVKLELPDRS